MKDSCTRPLRHDSEVGITGSRSLAICCSPTCRSGRQPANHGALVRPVGPARARPPSADRAGHPETGPERQRQPQQDRPVSSDTPARCQSAARRSSAGPDRPCAHAGSKNTLGWLGIVGEVAGLQVLLLRRGWDHAVSIRQGTMQGRSLAAACICGETRVGMQSQRITRWPYASAAIQDRHREWALAKASIAIQRDSRHCCGQTFVSQPRSIPTAAGGSRNPLLWPRARSRQERTRRGGFSARSRRNAACRD